MNKFDYLRAASPDEAVQALSTHPGARIMAGGTELLPLMKDNLASPQLIIDLSAWEDGSRVEQTPQGLRIGATATLASIASSAEVQEKFTALADACVLSAAPQLRNMGTIGGNLLQQTRCWYYRGAFDCWLKGGEICYARGGQNEQHSILHTAFQESPCVSAHPSDPAAALLALDAFVEYTGPAGNRQLALESLYALPSAERRTFTTLPVGAVITAIVIPDTAVAMRSTYVKAMPRATWAFALAGVALAIGIENAVISEARVGLSGVAPVPVRAPHVERLMVGRSLESLDHDELGRELTSSALPLQMNGYKVALLRGLFKQALAKISARETGHNKATYPRRLEFQF